MNNARKALLSVFIALATTPVFAQFCTPDTTGNEAPAAAVPHWLTLPIAEGVYLVYSPEAQARLVGLPWLISGTDNRLEGLPWLISNTPDRDRAR